ncbi:MAG: cyclic nucleotide-binding domain-containing protein [Candidatus Riflebacteria bacterium]|nr:cyclic nucleotide-binding domain-containing protein [Candidatus Riflebacteria bacterium]
MSANLSDFLKGVSLFSALSDDQIKTVLGRVEVVKYVRDAVICKEGEKADSMFVIKSGIVQIFCDDGHSGRKILTHLKLGEYFGEMSLLTDDPRTASASALAETELIKINKDDFQMLLKSIPEVALTIIRTLCDRLAKANIGTSNAKKFNVFAVMGPDTSSGKSFFARNLAAAFKELLEKSILLYDPNLRDDRVAKNLGIPAHSRIIDELVDREKITDIHKYVAQSPSGTLTIVPQENGLTDLRLKEFHTFSIMKTVLESFEFIVIDSSSMFTKVTKEIVQSCDKIIYLISSKNVSIGGLIDHFEETRRTWKVDPSKVIYGVNHLTDDPSKESIITEKDRNYIRFELPYVKALATRREPDEKVLIQRESDAPMVKALRQIAEDVLFDQEIKLFLPQFSEDPTKSSLAKRWTESGLNELSAVIRNLAITEGATWENQKGIYLHGKTAKWLLNTIVPAVVDFANRFKQEFKIEKTSISINRQESII